MFKSVKIIRNNHLTSAVFRMNLSRSISQSSLPSGFKASGVHCGIKKDAKLKDLSLITSESPCVVSGIFTQNKFCAAPVTLCKSVLSQNKTGIRSLVVNSGCANAVTGQKGLENAKVMAKLGDRVVGTKEIQGEFGYSSLVMSTGVIGHHLPMENIKKGIDYASKALANTPESWLNCAEGFMTTDTRPKLRARSHVLKGSNTTYKMVGISKGAGMIHPNMATLLSMVATDLSISPKCLDEALKFAGERSFNSISIDGDTSTNDTCLVLANGDQTSFKIDNINSEDFLQFRSDLTELMTELAQLIVRDAEGATKFVTVNVRNAPTYEVAKIIVSSICTSALVKTALYGQDANWGRIVCAIGYSGVDEVDPSKVSLTLLPKDKSQSLKLLINGEPVPMDEARALEVMSMDEINLDIDLNIGSEEATMWTCDFSHEYVTINGSYRS